MALGICCGSSRHHRPGQQDRTGSEHGQPGIDDSDNGESGRAYGCRMMANPARSSAKVTLRRMHCALNHLARGGEQIFLYASGFLQLLRAAADVVKTP